MPDPHDDAAAQPLERKLATILSADVAEFSRLMGEDEEGTLRTFRGHKQVFESLVTMHRGRVFNTAGDAILAEFASAVEAVRCATDIQAALRTRNDQLPPNRQVRFRIGINLGDVMLQGQDLMGDGVNVAARLQTAAEPGGICISGSVHDQIRNKLSLSFHSLGEMSFKNIQQPVRTFSVTEGEGIGVLPARKVEKPKRGSTGLMVAALVVILLAAGGYWAYTMKEKNKLESAAAPTPAPTSTSVPAAASSTPATATLPPAGVKPVSAPPASTPAPAPEANKSAAPHPVAPTHPQPKAGPSDSSQLPQQPSPLPARPASSTNVPNFAGTWEPRENTMNGVPQSLVNPQNITITQDGNLVRVGGRELQITGAGAVTYTTFFAHDNQHGHRVATEPEADLADTLTWSLEGSNLVFKTVFDYKHQYYNHAPGTDVRIIKYRRTTGNN
jgi:class 3 adenylate cyclase